MTIYALSSGPGISGVAVIRVSGKETISVIKALTGKDLPRPRVATLRKINNSNTFELIDEGIILWFPGPQSYTGEDMVEFHVHGSKAVVEAIQNSISQVKDCRLAEPGEFTKLAFQNGKINLLKAESIADLISSETEIQRKQAIKIMNGKSSNKFAVVDEDCRVFGVDNLYIADASIMPDTVRANTNVTTMMIGERLSDFLKGSE